MIRAMVNPLITGMICGAFGFTYGEVPLLSLNFQSSTLPSGLTFSRASSATDIINGVLTTFPSGSPRMSTTNGLLIEPQATNILLNSATPYTDWVASYASTTTLYAGAAFLGYFSNGAVVTGTQSYASIRSGWFNVVAGTDYAWSVYVAAGTSGKISVFIGGDSTATESNVSGTLGSQLTTTLTNTGTITHDGTRSIGGGYILWGTFTSNATAARKLYIGPASTTGETVIAFGGQIEAGIGATSFIPTGAAAATRAADQLSLTDPTVIPYAYGRAVITAKTSGFNKTTSPSQTILVMANASENILFRKDRTTLKMKATSTGLTNAVDVSDEVLGAVGVSTDITQDLRWSPDGWFLNDAADLTTDSFSSALTSVTIGNGLSAGDNWGGYIKSFKVYGYDYLTPNTAATFSGLIGGNSGVNRPYELLRDFVFGTAATAGFKQTAITDLTALETWFNSYSDAAPGFSINHEVQRYRPINSTNHVLTSNALELTATLDNPALTPLITRNPSSNVTYSRVVPLANTTGLSVGQIVGFGPVKGYDNLHVTQTLTLKSASGTWTPGGSASITFTDANGSFSPITISVTAGTSDSDSVFAAAMVAAINANSTLNTAKIKAYQMPQGAYAFTYPKNSLSAPADFGDAGKGALTWVGTSLTKTEGTHNWVLNVSGSCHIEAINPGVSVTLNHPVDLLTTDTMTFSPCYKRPHNNGYTGSTYTVDDTTGLSVGQLVQFAYQDSNPVRINSLTSTTVTCSTGTGVNPGGYLTFLPAYMAYTVGAVTDSYTITLDLVPTNLQAGHVLENTYAVYGHPTTVGVIKVVSIAGNVVTLDTQVTIPNNTRLVFLPPIYSGQIWLDSALQLVSPSLPNTDLMAISLSARFPNAAALGAWPACWLFSGMGGNKEYDFTDTFHDFNNSTRLGSYLPQGGIATYQTTVNGNNLGSFDREMSGIIEKRKCSFYLDNKLTRIAQLEKAGHPGVVQPWDVADGQIGVNLACGAITPGNFQNGLFPLDFSQFPMKYSISRLRVWKAVR